MIEFLRIEGLRNIVEADVWLERGCALVSGSNGAGKTTVLEALYLLARGKTFRGSRAGDLTNEGASETRILGRMGVAAGGVHLLFVRSGRVANRWIDGIPLSETTSASGRLSVRLVGENSQQLLDGDPSLRRRYLDWNLFHVEPGYGQALRRYRLILEQRNAWLRQGARGRNIWDDSFLEAGEDLQRRRISGVTRIAAVFRAYAARVPYLAGVELLYVPGIPDKQTFSQALAADRCAERISGFTRIGPHRADIRLHIAGRWPGLSRGQQKAAVCFLQLASAAVQEAASGQKSVWLLDDFWGDFDSDSAGMLLSMFLSSGAQIILTTVSSRPPPLPTYLPTDTTRLHMTAGRVERIQ